jgi:predicted transcriptional regulator of viral defense system
MATTYLDAIDHLYGTSEFTVRDFAIRVANPRAGKLLSDLKARGYVARVGRGRYRRLGPGERPDLRRFEWRRVREVLLNGPGVKAWAGSSAVELWTDGRYRTSPSVFVRLFTLAVPRASLGDWDRYLRAKGLSRKSKRRIGPRIELLPVENVKVTFHDGEPVIPRSAVLELIRAHPAIFANAEELVHARPR